MFCYFHLRVISQYLLINSTWDIRLEITVSKLLPRANENWHYSDVIMTTMEFQITSLTIVNSTVYSGADQRYNIKAPRDWPLWGEFAITGEFPAQRASNAENVFTWWRHHGSRDRWLSCCAASPMTTVQTSAAPFVFIRTTWDEEFSCHWENTHRVKSWKG